MRERHKLNDLTIIHYTANLVEETFARNIRNHLLSLFPEGVSIISVSHKLMDFGVNIHVPNLVPSIYNIYKQILIGTKEAKTGFVAMHEDDALYNIEHFSHRPKKDSFSYNLNRWNVNEDLFFHRNRENMSMCIAPRELMVETLEKRFEKYPNLLIREKGELIGFGEPGRFEAKLGLPEVKMETFNTRIPTLVFNHRPSVGGVRKLLRRDTVKKELPYWGNAKELWNRFYG